MQKVLLIDDEAPARQLLREYLSEYPELVIVGEASNGVDALRLIDQFDPELLFLDVQMPGMTGFELLQRLDKLPQVIFSTAYDQYALEAFELNAVDYLLKPYTKARFAKAVERVMQRQDQNLDQLRNLTESLMARQMSQRFPGKILVQRGNRLISVDTDAIVWIRAERDYASLITKDDKFLSNYGIGQLEEKLDPSTFIRVHRSSIINVNYISEIFKYAAAYDVRMSNGDVVRVSRSYLEVIRDLTF